METNNVTQWVIIGAAAIILIVGGAWLAVRGNRAGSAATSTDTMATTTATTSSSVDATKNVPKGTVSANSDGEKVVISNQKAGSSVKVEAMSLTRATWIAIRDDQSILGAAWFPANATGGNIELQRATVAGKSYRAVMYVDNGDKKFDYKQDQLIEASGSPVGASFDAQ